MLLLSIGLLTVLIALALILADMERKRRRLAELIERLRPLVVRRRRVVLANLIRLSRSPLYAYGLIRPLEREIALLERDHGLPGVDGDPRQTSIRASRRIDSLTDRLAAVEATR